MKKVFLIFCCLFFSSLSLQAQNDPVDSQKRTREFIMSCTYGVLTGTLIGAASLAFSDSPGDNLHRIARGASLGLYAGIALGYYIMNLDENPEVIDPLQYPAGDIPPPLEGSFQVLPKFEQAKLDGIELKFQLMKF
ncbi:MAG: hypothetical protein VX583_05995 [Bdellovibrionota bacterium]|nr:hypothetical protein [Pseudobdellovibrionaceae bacterium]|tara:strand:+ start:52532 stop:52939 length:408 start_codon:yes stop_codon:yes gene_type:complete